ncbi:NAD(P)/FAD-dependent oxidoreductase [Mariniblastus fucicola]|uniref:Sulfide dehydrogenase [flavocytochrome c] flavoprotein chain n=1 Tax=Mariniblastus fucicola TaxID=980251 RepID=A0A5B9PE10_9BACT|nr:FAD/NAD(P)-binding oxidoreductase [Mariniblastus fucicola]QEG23729.1 Sulfide dehydrogenase [flavocytochrome c] flavoprotein chain precursor [Mariniblastus fucicola]
MSNPKIVIVGGGSAGLTTAAHLLNSRSELDVTIIEPSEKHYYQPLWTLIGGGVFPKEESEREQADFIPHGATWMKDAVESFDPENNTVKTVGGESVPYDYLVVCPGLQLNWSETKGLTKDIVGKHGICSNYSYDTVETTWETIRNFKGGTALFTHPDTPVKCGGAPQKICYLAEDYFRKQGIRDQCNVVFALAKPRIFAVDPYATTLEKRVKRKDIDVRLQHNLVEIRPETKEAVFEHLDTGEESVIKYDMLHVTPRMGPRDFVKNSPLAAEDGWVDVDKHTTQHVRYPNVFALGDTSNLPTSKTGAAIRKQAPTASENILCLIDGKPLSGHYTGYTSCPLVTSYSTMVLAEFDYDKNPMESFPFDQSQERFSMYMLKKYGLPNLYWHGMLRGRA